MSDLPTLIVEGDPADFEAQEGDPCPVHGRVHNAHGWYVCHTFRIDGPLPTVEDCLDGEVYFVTRPLRVGDRVTLFYIDYEYDFTERPFATATVTDIVDLGRWCRVTVTVTDVEAL